MSDESLTPEQLLDRVEETHDRFMEAQRAFLRATGWSYSSTHPDFCWRWSKSFNGVNYSMGQDEAVTFQQRSEPIEEDENASSRF